MSEKTFKFLSTIYIKTLVNDIDSFHEEGPQLLELNFDQLKIVKNKN